jgi:hypothetical protein
MNYHTWCEAPFLNSWGLNLSITELSAKEIIVTINVCYGL